MGILRADILTHSQLESAGGSVDFDGTGDFLTIPDHSAFHFTGDYTIDFYIKFSTFSGTQRIFGQRNSNASDLSVLGEFASNNFYYYYSQNGTNSENIIIGSSGSSDETKNLELNTWYHVAIVSDGGVHHSYLNGVLTAVNVNNSPPLKNASSTWSIGRQGAFTSNEFSGSIYGFRITIGALYKDNFTVSKFKPKVLPGTLLLCCVSSTSVTEAEVSVAGDITSNGDPQIGDTPLLKEDITDTGVVFDGFTVLATSTYMVPPGGNTRERNRGRALFGGGSTIDNTIQSLSIQSQGNTEDFGDLSTGRYETECASSSTRGIWGGGYTESPNVKVDVIEFVTIANSSNTTDFGNLTVARGHLAGMCNSTRGVFANGTTNPSPHPVVNTIDYITIATAGNATNFGDSTTASKPMGGGRSSTTRGIFTLGNAPSAVNNIEYITIASTGDSQDFGDLTGFSGWGKGAGNISSGTRAILGGGHEALNNIEYITIASLGNGTNFGDLIVGRRSAFAAGSKTRGVFAGGKNPSQLNSIEYIEIATTGNALDFGDMINSKSFASGLSDCHGGLS